MSPKKPTPAPGVAITGFNQPRRVQSATSRDLEGMSERQKREASPRPVPAFVEEESSQNYEVPEERAAFRAARDDDKRLALLEEKADNASEKADAQEKKLDGVIDRLGKVEVAVAGFSGEMKILPSLVDSMNKATDALRAREHMIVTTKVDIDKAQALADVEVKKSEGLTEQEVKKKKWELAGKVAAIAAAIWTTVSTVLLAKGC